MNDETKKILKDQMAILPEDVRNAIISVDYQKALQQVTKNNMLLIDQAGKLETETTLVLLGLEPLKDYAGNLSTNLEISKEKGLVLAHDVDELVFKNIRNSLKKINDKFYVDELPKETFTNTKEPTKEDILSGIENSSKTPSGEESVSLSSLKSNSANPENLPEEIYPGIEVKNETSLEIPPEAMLPAKIPTWSIKTPEPLHENVSPIIANIVEEKLSKPVDVPKENVVVEETTKIPTKSSSDPYREPIM